MNQALLLAGLFAGFLGTATLAQASPLDQAPSPTIVYCDLVTTGGSAGDLSSGG